jgi:hypothetical protein
MVTNIPEKALPQYSSTMFITIFQTRRGCVLTSHSSIVQKVLDLDRSAHSVAETFLVVEPDVTLHSLFCPC